MIATTTHLQCLLGGLGISLAAHQLLLLNGNVLGVSGFVHQCHRRGHQWLEKLAGVLGIVLSGTVAALIDGRGPAPFTHASTSQLVLSGALVGLGSKLANGCTSGHMICGISRLSIRSISATAAFFTTAAAVARLVHQKSPSAGLSHEWALSGEAYSLLALQSIPFAIFGILYLTSQAPSEISDKSGDKPHCTRSTTLRVLASTITNYQFGLALLLSTLSEPTRVLNFLLLPFHRAYDPSLFYVAAGALPLGIVLYRYARGSERSCIDGSWSIPTNTRIDARLIGGAAIFGVGWGLSGICPGPALVGFGRALGSGGQQLIPYIAWLSSFVVGGLLV